MFKVALACGFLSLEAVCLGNFADDVGEPNEFTEFILVAERVYFFVQNVI
jgi:hypothetical protein